MKQLLIFLMTYSGIAQCKTQDSTITLSHFEAFTFGAGHLLKTEAQTIGEVSGYTISKIKSTDVATGADLWAIRLFPNEEAIPLVIDPRVIYIDSADVSTIVNVLATFSKLADGTAPATDVQFTYVTTTDIAASFYYDRFADSWRFNLGKVYQRLRSPVAGSSMRFNKKRAKELAALLAKL